MSTNRAFRSPCPTTILGGLWKRRQWYCLMENVSTRCHQLRTCNIHFPCWTEHTPHTPISLFADDSFMTETSKTHGVMVCSKAHRHDHRNVVWFCCLLFWFVEIGIAQWNLLLLKMHQVRVLASLPGGSFGGSGRARSSGMHHDNVCSIMDNRSWRYFIIFYIVSGCLFFIQQPVVKSWQKMHSIASGPVHIHDF